MILAGSSSEGSKQTREISATQIHCEYDAHVGVVFIMDLEVYDAHVGVVFTALIRVSRHKRDWPHHHITKVGRPKATVSRNRTNPTLGNIARQAVGGEGGPGLQKPSNTGRAYSYTTNTKPVNPKPMSRSPGERQSQRRLFSTAKPETPGLRWRGARIHSKGFLDQTQVGLSYSFPQRLAHCYEWKASTKPAGSWFTPQSPESRTRQA